MDDEQVLSGGVANAGAVVRSGDDVLRPSNAHSGSIHRLLSAVRAHGFTGASEPVGIDPDGRERLRFVPGDVPLPPYPDWAQTDQALASVARLIAGLHDATVGWSPSDTTWSDELADPKGGPVMCHNDVCLENVVFRDGLAVALVDFDYAAPGRREFDLAAFARMCVPIDDDVNAARLGWNVTDKPGRLRMVCDAYGCDAAGRALVLAEIGRAIEAGGEFVRRHVEAGDPGFVEMWNDMGGQERFDRRRQWWSDNVESFTVAL